jgi:radical SAM protein with 4Fe4S-binding SPASM domain
MEVKAFQDEYWLSLPLRAIVLKQYAKYICGVGKLHLVVTPNGNIYPCQYFIGAEEFNMGNVLSPTASKKFLAVQKKLDVLDHNLNEKCKKCWAKYLCKSCPCIVYQKTDKLDFPDEFCNKQEIFSPTKKYAKTA